MHQCRILSRGVVDSRRNHQREDRVGSTLNLLFLFLFPKNNIAHIDEDKIYSVDIEIYLYTLQFLHFRLRM